VVLSRTPLDLASEDVAGWAPLVEGHHEIPLRWRRAFPSDTIRGFEESTVLSLDVTLIAAEDAVCSNGGNGGYETEGLDGQHVVRFELAMDLSTADGAIRGSVQQSFYPLRDVTVAGERIVVGGGWVPFEEIAGTLELGVDPELESATQMLSVQLNFDEQSVKGVLTPWVYLPAPALGDDPPRWAPIAGDFPAPDEGCEAGHSVPLDAHLDLLGDTPRSAYERARSRFPTGPIKAAWEDQLHTPGSFTWTEVMLGAGEPTHACLNDSGVDLYTSLRIESSDGIVLAEPSVIATVDSPTAGGSAASAVRLFTSTTPRWTPSAQFEATAGIRDLDLGLAEYGELYLRQAFIIDADHDQLQGEFHVAKWENYSERPLDRPVLLWCAGADCERFWCLRAATDGGASCF